MKTGIYEIRNIENNYRYIGSAQNFNRRKSGHFSLLRRGKHYNIHLQRAFDKYGEASFIFNVLENCSEEDLIIREQWYFDNFNPEYNIAPTAGNSLYRKHTKESIEKIRQSSIERKDSEATKNALEKGRRHNKGKRFSTELKIKLSLAKTGGKKRPIKRICINTKEEKIYEYLFLVKEDGFLYSKVSECCNGKRKTHKKYNWEYAD